MDLGSLWLLKDGVWLLRGVIVLNYLMQRLSVLRLVVVAEQVLAIQNRDFLKFCLA